MYLSIYLCLWMWKKVKMSLILTKSNFLQHIDMLLRNQLPNIIGWIENQWHELARLNQITTFTISHQPLTNFLKAISYYLNFKCGWQHTNLPSETHKYKTLEPGLVFIVSLPFSSCHTSKYAFLFPLFPLSQFNVPPPIFGWVVGKLNATIFKALPLSLPLSLPLYFRNLTGHSILQRNMLSSSKFPSIMLSGDDILQLPLGWVSFSYHIN